MDSLVANYASSDEDEEHPPKQDSLPLESSRSSSSLFSSLPKPKPSSLFQSLPQPKQPSAKPSPSLPNPSLGDNGDGDEQDSRIASKPKSSSLFFSLPQPKSQVSQPSKPNSKRVVQFKLPVNPYSVKSSQIDDEDEEDEEEEKERKRRKESESSSQTPSVSSFLTSIPAPRNSTTLGVLPSSGSGRRAIVETQVSASNSGDARADTDSGKDNNVGNYGNNENLGDFQSNVDQNSGNYEQYYRYGNYESGSDQNAVNYESSGSYGNYVSGFDQSAGVSQMGSGISGEDGSSYGYYDGHGSNVDYGHNWVEGSTTPVVDVSNASHSSFKIGGKRGRNEIPTEIVEVKQDELMKNRPREDQVKLTGIAFGPAYQPVSVKGKPSKLLKRKHQIGTLYFDMKQKETELAERRSRGYLTKAETQAKYGW